MTTAEGEGVALSLEGHEGLLGVVMSRLGLGNHLRKHFLFGVRHGFLSSCRRSAERGRVALSLQGVQGRLGIGIALLGEGDHLDELKLLHGGHGFHGTHDHDALELFGDRAARESFAAHETLAEFMKLLVASQQNEQLAGFCW